MTAPPRIDYPAFPKLAPDASAALGALGRQPDSPGLDKALIELVKIRASQINGCAFCLHIHLGVARRIGVAAIKLDLLAAWHDATVFSAREQAALAWAECLTSLPDAGAPDARYAALRAHFTEAEIARLSVAIATINAWNRLGAGLRFAPQLPSEPPA